MTKQKERGPLVAATHNKGKLAELRELMQPLGFTVHAPADYGCTLEPEETGSTFEENAWIKASEIAKACGVPALADDSGLEVFALNGAPGVYSARYAGEGATDADRLWKLLGELRDIPEAERGAQFVCALSFAEPDGTGFTVRGECPGRILTEPRGSGGFGYDPVFWYEPLHATFAELPAEEKNGVSHRARAMEKLRDELAKRL